MSITFDPQFHTTIALQDRQRYLPSHEANQLNAPLPETSRSAYLDNEQRLQIAQERNNPLWQSEWPTWLLIAVIYGGWYAALTHRQQLGQVVSALLLIWFCAWHMSLQHELLHGHPTRWAWFNRLLGYPPLAVWYPYKLYRDSHLRHHVDFHLTMPALDTESFYVSPARWAEMSKPLQAIYRINKTFWGRLLFGAAIAILTTWANAVREPLHGNWKNVPMWLRHIAILGGMLWWIHASFGISPFYYLLIISYPAQSLTMIRSYYEHRPAADCKQRIVLNEAGWLFRLLFLNNNFHLVHHDFPAIPWYLLPRIYHSRREAYIARSGGFHVHGYLELMRRFGFTLVDAPVHPYMAD
jgi:fatty acid desaturase